MKHVAKFVISMGTGFILVLILGSAYYSHLGRAYHKELCVTLGNLDPDCDQRWIDTLPPRVVLQALCDQGNQFMCDYLAI